MHADYLKFGIVLIKFFKMKTLGSNYSTSQKFVYSYKLNVFLNVSEVFFTLCLKVRIDCCFSLLS